MRTNIFCHELPPNPLFSDVSAESASRGELSQAVSNHILGYVDGHMATTIMDSDGMTHHLRKNHAGAIPGANNLFLTAFVHGLNFAQ
jgi:hypothetical protein